MSIGSEPITQQGVLRPGEPPEAPPGWCFGPPDFVGVGFQRCGTTRWFNLVTAHPAVQPPLSTAPLSTRKELHYFDRYFEDEFGPADRERYAHYFPRPRGCLTGEWTPTYAADYWVPPLLASAAPNARLLVLVRDPVDRYLSGMQRQHRVARATEAPLHYIAIQDSFSRGFYHDQLVRLLSHFDRTRMLVLQHERCVRDPLRELRRTFEFLGLDAFDTPDNLRAQPNRQPIKPPLPASTRKALIAAYRDDVSKLFRLCPELEPDLWPNFAE